MLSEFVLNAEKSAADTIPATKLEKPQSEEESLIFSYRQKKNRALRLVSLQTAAFLNWDLDVLTKLVKKIVKFSYSLRVYIVNVMYFMHRIHVSTQHAFMKHVLNVAQPDPAEESRRELSKEFLRVLYHRWVLRTFQSHNAFAKTAR